MINRYYLYQPDTDINDIYFLMDDCNKRTPEFRGRTYIISALKCITKPEAALGWFVGSIPTTQLHMYLSLNPELTIVDLAAILRSHHEMPLL